MDKRLKLSISIAVAFILLVIIWVSASGWQLFTHIVNYDHISIEAVVADAELAKKFHLVEKPVPKAYGFEDYREINFNSLDKTPLSGWLVKSKVAAVTSCVIFAHGRAANRMMTLPFLSMAQDSSIFGSKTHYFLADLRMAGKAGKGNTSLGYNLAEDLAASMLFLNKEFGTKNFMLYGFEAGAMAAVLTVSRKDLAKLLAENRCKVEALILDSPISNASELMYRKSEEEIIFLQQSIFNVAKSLADIRTNNLFDEMRIGILKNHDEIPVLVLQNLGDELTPTDMLLNELKQASNAEVHFFDGEKHSGMFFNPKYKRQYIETLKDFTQKEGLVN